MFSAFIQPITKKTVMQLFKDHHIKGGMTDLVGNALADDFKATFTTQ